MREEKQGMRKGENEVFQGEENRYNRSREKEREERKIEYEDIWRKDKENQRRERRNKTEGSRYNKWYKRVKGERMPNYLRKEWEESKWRRVVRFKLKNEI